MSAEELHEYNASVGLRDQVYCSEDVRTGSHIRSRSCSSYGKTLSDLPGRLDGASSSKSFTYVR